MKTFYRFQRLVCLFLTTAMIICLTGCSVENDSKTGQVKKENAQKISIVAGKNYSITKEDERKTTFETTFTSTDSSVAVLRDGKYILALRPGNTEITVTNGDVNHVYDVTVSADPNQGNRSTNSQTIENDIRIGYGYNAMGGEELNEFSLTKPIFNWNKILKSNELLMDDSEEIVTKSFNGSTMDEFMDSYSKKTTVQISVKIFGIKVYGKRKEFTELNVNHVKNVVDINQIYLQIQKSAYYFPEDENGYASYVLPDVWKKLMGTDENKTTVKQFVKEYGTHILTSGIYGGSFEWNYVLADSDKCMLDDGCKCLYNYLREKYASDDKIMKQIKSNMKGFLLKRPDEINKAMFQGANLLDASVGLTQQDREQYFKTIAQKKYGMNTSTRFVGDGANFANISVAGQSFDQTISNYMMWRDTLQDGVLIGPRDEFSLYPVWELIPADTQEGKARREEFAKLLEE